MDDFNCFKDCTYTELCDIYFDIISKANNGLNSPKLNKYADFAKQHYQFPGFIDAYEFTKKLFYEEIAKRYFTDSFKNE